MAFKFFCLLFALLAIMMVALPIQSAARPGGWSQIENPKDPEVLKIVEFAVNEHNKQAKTNLAFETVVSGESQVVAGTKYRLVISASGGSSGNYRAVVWDKPWQKLRELESFEAA